MNIYDAVTERIVNQLEQGVIPWRKEWKSTGPSSLPFNKISEKPYRGIFKGGTTFGDCDYSKEELVAEFTAAFLCGEVGLSNERLELNHAAYIQGWMRALKNDKKMLISAAQKAQRAADLVLDRSYAAASETVPEQAVEVAA